MKISVDKSMTTINALPQVKEDLREFKARYTDGDLLRAFMDATEFATPWAHDIIRAEVEGYADCLSDTNFYVKMITRNSITFCDISFFCNMDLKVRTDEPCGHKMWSCEVYERKSTIA